LGKAEQIILCVTFLFKGMTLNKKMRLDHEALRLPETSIFKWSGYSHRLRASALNLNVLSTLSIKALHIEFNLNLTVEKHWGFFMCD